MSFREERDGDEDGGGPGEPGGGVRVAARPWNPRTIKDERFANLCASIEADPEFIWLRPILAMIDGTVWGGNMRLRAAQHLGMESVPAILVDIPTGLASVPDLRRVLEIAMFDVLGLDNSVARARALASLVTTAAKLLETGEFEARLEAIEGVVGARNQKKGRRP